MATVKAIKYGMKGDDVSNLQTSLKNAGYNIDVDGSFGPQTLAAVKDYQQKNGLTVDGMVGPQTQQHLFGGNTNKPAGSTNMVQNAGDTVTKTNLPQSAGDTVEKTKLSETSGTNATSGSAASPSTNIQMPDAPAYEAYNAPDYVKSETVQQAYATLQAILAAQPGAYQSKWQGQINEMIDRILNREKFTYDINSDALYQQYADQYKNLGKLAMQDTMGQAAAMTGGYGNSYAQSVGQQAYQGYLSQLNEMVPELYGMALDQYNREGQEMYNQYGLLSDQEAQDYGRYRDAYNDWLAERDYATGRYDTEYDRDYGQYWDKVNMDYQVHTDEQNRAWNEYVTAIQQTQWEKEYEAGEEQREIDNAYRDKVFASDEEQREIDNAYRAEGRARDDVNSIIAGGGTPTDEQLAAAGMSRETANALSNAYKNAENNLTAGKELSANDIKGISSQVADLAENENLEAAEAYLTMLINNGYITKDEAKSFLAPYVEVEEEEIVDTGTPIWTPQSTGTNYPDLPLDPSQAFEGAKLGETEEEKYERWLKNLLGIK